MGGIFSAFAITLANRCSVPGSSWTVLGGAGKNELRREACRSLKPAYHIALTATEKRLISDLAAIQSQIEWLMQLSIKKALVIDHETARAVLGSTNLGANADIWIRIMREDHPYEEGVAWAEYAFSEMAALAKGRNDFLHTLFGFAPPGGDENDLYFNWGHLDWEGEKESHRLAVRVKSHAVAPLGDLRKVRDRAAYLSIAVAHVEWTAGHDHDDGSPWLRRLGGPLPPPRGEWGPRKATKRPSSVPRNFRKSAGPTAKKPCGGDLAG